MMLSKHYISLIKINGRPILPPVMTEERAAEMQFYKDQAVIIEQRLLKCAQFNKTVSDEEAHISIPPKLTSSEFIPEHDDYVDDKNNEEIEHDVNDLSLNKLKLENSTENEENIPKSSLWFTLDDTDTEETISMPSAIIVEGIGFPEQENEIDISPRTDSMKTPLTEIDSSPSLASTDLGKYMDISPEEMSPKIGSQFDRTESSSTCSTVKENYTPETKLNKSMSCDGIASQNKYKHVRRSSYTLECPSPALTAQVDMYKEKGMIFPVDMCSISRTSLESMKAESACDILTQKTQLYRYLENVARFPLEDGDDGYEDLEEEVNYPFTSYEELLLQPDVYFNKLRSSLHLHHKEQLDEFLRCQEEGAYGRKLRVGDNESYENEVMNINFDRVSAAVKGYLTRRLLRTERVQEIIKTIRDTLEFALHFHNETPVKLGRVTPGEATLHKQILQQLTSSCHEFHDVFFKFSTKEKMKLIAQDRLLLEEKVLESERKAENMLKRNLSTATLKVLERKKVKLQSDMSNSAPTSRDRSPRSKSAFSLRTRKIRAKSDICRVASSKGIVSQRTSSPRLQSRSTSRSSLGSDRSHRSVRRNLSNIYAQEGNRTFRVQNWMNPKPEKKDREGI